MSKTEKSKDVVDEEDEEEEEEEDEDIEDDDTMEIQQWEEQIKDIITLLSQSVNQKLPDDYIVRMMRVFLAKDRCQSHGYVLDGFPKTLQQVLLSGS